MRRPSIRLSSSSPKNRPEFPFGVDTMTPTLRGSRRNGSRMCCAIQYLICIVASSDSLPCLLPNSWKHLFVLIHEFHEPDSACQEMLGALLLQLCWQPHCNRVAY